MEYLSISGLYKFKKILYDKVGWNPRNTFYTKRGGAARWRRIPISQPNGKRK